MLASAVLSLALAGSALATVFITEPVASTVFNGGQAGTIQWQDDGNSPSLAQFGNAIFGLYIGNALQQTLVQTLAENVPVGSASAISFTVDPKAGPNSGEYFIRCTSNTLKQSSSSQYYMESFSAKFTLSGMSGSFNSSEQAEINGQSTAPLATPSPLPSQSSGSTPAGTGVTITAAPVSSSSSDSSSSANGAVKPAITTGLVGLVAIVLGASFL